MNVESLVRDAFDAPEVPDSLSRRLDAGIAEIWGESPELVARRGQTITKAAVASWQRVRGWSLAVAMAGCVMATLIIATSSNGYAWASMLEAIARQGVFHIDGPEIAGDPEPLSMERGLSASQRAGYFLAAILRDDPRFESSIRLDGIRLVEESWQRKGNGIDLRAKFETGSDDAFELRCRLDPETQLPREIEVLSPQASPRLVSVSFEDRQGDAIAVRPDASLPVGESVAAVSDLPRPETVSPKERDSDPLPDRSGAFDSKQGRESAAKTYATQVPRWPSVRVASQPSDVVLKAVNHHMMSLWAGQGVQPVAPATDLELFRRVHLDLAGRTPSVTEVRRWLSDQQPYRYERLVDRLLGSPDHASHLASTWRAMLIPDGVDVSRMGGVAAFDRWLATQYQSGTRYDEIVQDLLLAEGRLSKSGPLLFYSALKLEAEKLAARTSRVFLGIRLECAQCHDHPFEPWKQQDFWSYAAFFAQISRPRGDLQTVSTLMRVRDVNRGDVMLPETEIAVEPRFLGQSVAPVKSGDSETTRRRQLARWIISPENPYFARATANRLWAMMFGKGLVDPVDDFGEANKPVAPEVLELLASQLIASDFELRDVLRTIALSDAYRLSSASQTDDATRLQTFAQMQVKTLTAAQLYDCIAMATLMDDGQANSSMSETVARFGNSARDEFLRQFASAPSNRVEYLAGIPHALTLMNGQLIHQATSEDSSGRLRSLDAPFFTDEQRIEVLFMATLSRPPRDDELAMMRELLAEDASQRQQAFSDLLWALINTAEFALNH